MNPNVIGLRAQQGKVSQQIALLRCSYPNGTKVCQEMISTYPLFLRKAVPKSGYQPLEKWINVSNLT